MNDTLVAEFAKLSTSVVSDALDSLRLQGGLHGIVPIIPRLKVCGHAFTVRYGPVGASLGTAGDYIDDVQPGQVVVIDNGGRTYCTVWGDILTNVAKQRGIAGTVIDGVCRDIDGIVEQQYPIYTRGTFMVTGKDRVQLVAVGDTGLEPVTSYV